ncbi:MAG: M14 family zinc carboxypeptidase, partial [Dehalococcoidia bacterium]
AASPPAEAATWAFPEAMAAISIGNSVQGRAIEMGCTGAGDRTVLVVGGVHTGPSEGVTTDLARQVAHAVAGGGIAVPDSLRVCVLPALNPDGVALGTRTNANEVDLNRNWPAHNWRPDAYHPGSGEVSGGDRPLSEPETSALYRHLAQARPAAIVVFHCCGALVEANEVAGAPEMGRAYAAAAGLAYIEEWTAYTINGQLLDAMDGVGIPMIDIELAHSGSTDFAQHGAGVAAMLATVAGESVTTSSGVERTAAVAPGGLYRIQPGDTISGVATRYRVSAAALLSTNYITRADQFVPGRLIRIPG